MHLSHHAITRSRYRALMISLHCHLSAFFRLPPGAPCLLSAAKGDFPARGAEPVGEVVEAGLPGQLWTVELAELPQEAGSRRPDGEALEIGKPALALLDAKKVAAEAVRQDHGRMRAPAVF